ncbi:ABC transporter ATP-binding protein [Rhizobium sp. KVB221]|uniref:ABC transporter ATP-binding protein n=1 Tax=Rhizobium setariae TaxID=2801340 RepID=A0A936YKV4_9HYPH|nr:ABC transporter ATP-binding protein [Rhizobium setariae]MBL0372269.1 ABC transporter ATP-binding protein [Rhizobium setariae]
MPTPLLETRALSAFYSDFQALFGIDFEISESETIAIIGSNGAGKSTFLKALAGQVSSKGQTLRVGGVNRGGWRAYEAVQAGVALVPEGRRLFASLSVEENLKAGAYCRRSGHWTLERIYELFPDLVSKRHNPGTALSGGQQQMVAIGRALMSNPALLLCDELSLGLAPKVIRDIYRAVPRIREHGTAVVVVEQDISQALAISDRVYCIQEGRVSLTGRPANLSRKQISEAYFGVREAV